MKAAVALDVELGRSGEDFAQDLNDEVNVGPGRDERWRELHNGVAPVVRATDEPPAEDFWRDVASQQSLGVVTEPGLFRPLVLHELDALEVARAADVPDDGDVLQRGEPGFEVGLVRPHVLNHALVLDDLEGL